MKNSFFITIIGCLLIELITYCKYKYKINKLVKKIKSAQEKQK